MHNYKYKFPKNIRDLGGIMNSEGKYVRDNIFIRSAHLSKISEKEAEILTEECQVKKIIDLRSPNEKINREDYIINSVDYYNIPIFEESSMGLTAGMGADVVAAVKQSKNKKELYDYIPDLKIVYPLMIESDYSVNKISEALHVITENRNGSVLYHCTAGKDRTGVITAILLELLKVPRNVIMEDYLITNKSLSKTAKKYSRLAMIFTGSRDISDKTFAAFSADSVYLNSIYDSINKKYGSMNSFIYDILGYSDKEINDFRDYSLCNYCQC